MSLNRFFIWLPLTIAVFLLSSCAPMGKQHTTSTAMYFPSSDDQWETISPEDEGWDTDALEEVFKFARNHNSSGLVILKNGRTLAARQWALENPPMVATIGYKEVWYHGDSPDGWAREDVASTQKSFIAVLAGIARDKGLLDFDAPVSIYLGKGWSQASPEQEAVITVRHLMAMSSGISEKLEFVFPAGEQWSYINKAYSLVNDVIQAATGREPNDFTREWLTEPLGLSQTEWIVRSEFFRQWNMNGLVTTAPDLARFGLMIQAGGRWNDNMIISRDSLDQILSASSEFNPSYGLLWWLNNPQGWRWVRGLTRVTPGKMFTDAPGDLVAAMGTSERRCYIVPSLGLVVTRTGSTWKLDAEGNFVSSRDFDQQLWTLLKAAMPL
jgi:CubicO group peptidase (beta-lactamase class C family)